MVRPILLIIAVVLSVALYRMISRGGKTYSYTRTRTVSISDDGAEQVTQGNEKGVIVINNKTVIIDGREYVYKPFGDDPLQAILEYGTNGLSSVRVLLPDGEKQFIIERAHSAKDATATVPVLV